MKYNKLGRTDIEISALCLGSMTWGTQNTENEGHAQIDYALEHGINFIDTAEMYPTTPLSMETQGDTERILGSWFKKTGRRGEVVLATKVTGKGYRGVRDGAAITPETIEVALNASLERLQTDYIDLYQLHWPNRGSYHFRQSWAFDPTGQDRQETLDHIYTVLQALDGHIRSGKIRHVGLSNESAWGTAQFLRIAAENSLPRMQSIQNEYSLLCRYFDLDLAELCHHEDVGLLSFSPWAAGMLTGKYNGGVRPKGSRADVSSENLGGRWKKSAFKAVEAYGKVAAKHGIDQTQMALAFCLTRPFMASAIFGATTMDQLRNSVAAADLTLSKDVMDDIAGIYRDYPIPY